MLVRSSWDVLKVLIMLMSRFFLCVLYDIAVARGTKYLRSSAGIDGGGGFRRSRERSAS